MEFSEVYRRYSDDIAITALSQRVPGLDYDDVVSEMTGCLWKAWLTWKPGHAGFGSYWWSLWLNRRSDITEAAYRLKRPKTVALGDELFPESRYLLDLVPDPPAQCTRQQRLVWMLLASGEPVNEVMRITGLSKRGYYDLIRSWRTKEVRSALLH